MENRKTSSKRREYAQSLVGGKNPFLQGRPQRDRPIDRDDLLNLEILLNIWKTVDEFLKARNFFLLTRIADVPSATSSSPPATFQHPLFGYVVHTTDSPGLPGHQNAVSAGHLLVCKHGSVQDARIGRAPSGAWGTFSRGA